MIFSENRFPLFRIMLGAPLAFRQRHRDEARGATALNAHQNAVLVVGARGVDRFAHGPGIGDALSSNFQNHVAFLEATLCRRALRIDLSDDDAILAGAGNAVGGWASAGASAAS